MLHIVQVLSWDEDTQIQRIINQVTSKIVTKCHDRIVLEKIGETANGNRTNLSGEKLPNIKMNTSAPPASRTPILRTSPNKMECLYQYAVEHGLDPEKFSIVTEADKKRWAGESFRGILEVDMRFYCGAIERKE